MSQESIRKALESRLKALTPTFPTAYENDKFKPTNGTDYQECALLPANPDNAVMGSGFYQELGVFQVVLKYRLGIGSKDIQTRAEAIRTHFKRGTTMLQDGITVIVKNTPAIASGFRDGDRWCVPVSISYQADINL